MGFTWLDHRLLSVDGTGYHSSTSVRSRSVARNAAGTAPSRITTRCWVQVLVHPEHRAAARCFRWRRSRFCAQMGQRKTTASATLEAAAAGPEVRREQPHLKLLVLEDALASNGPHIELLRSLDMRFVLGVKPGDHKHRCSSGWTPHRGRGLSRQWTPAGCHAGTAISTARL